MDLDLLKRITSEGNPTINKNCKPELVVLYDTLPETITNDPAIKRRLINGTNQRT